MRKNKNKYQRKILFKKVILLIVVILLVVFGVYYYIHEEKLKKEHEKAQGQEITIKSHYNKFVITNDKAKLYQKENNQYEESGEINKGIELSLEEKNITVVIVLHELNNACRFADNIIGLKKGKIICEGKPLEVINKENLKEIYGIEANLQKSENGLYPICMDYELLRGEA